MYEDKVYVYLLKFIVNKKIYHYFEKKNQMQDVRTGCIDFLKYVPAHVKSSLNTRSPFSI